jgi:hypothetical protein
MKKIKKSDKRMLNQADIAMVSHLQGKGGILEQLKK